MDESERRRKQRQRIRRIAAGLLVLGCAVLGCLAQCAGESTGCEVDGSSRTLGDSLPSPDGRRIAMFIRANGGATTPIGAIICVEEAGTRRMLAWSGRSGGPTMHWHSSTELDVDDLRRDEPSHRFDVSVEQPPLLLYRDGSVGCSTAEPCSELYHCAIDGACWRDGYDPDPAVVRTAQLRRDGIAIDIAFHENAERIDSLRLIDAGGDAYEAHRYSYPDDGEPTDIVLTRDERAALLVAVSQTAFTDHEEPRALSGCARIVRSRNWHTDFAVVCLPETSPLLDAVAPLLGRTWP